MRFLIALVIFISADISQADLLGRLRIEEVLKERIEQAVRINDESARITIRIEYDKYEPMGEELPGMNHSGYDAYYAEKSEDSDIKKIQIQYYSDRTEMTAEQSELIYAQIPTQKNKINIVFKSVPQLGSKPIPVQPKDLAEMADKSVQMLSQMLGLFLGGGVFIFIVALFFNNSKNRAVFKQQIGNLVSSLSNGVPGFLGSGERSASAAASTVVSTAATSEKQIFSDFPLRTLSALFSDLYWCEKDGVAHYLWNNITALQKSELVKELEFLHSYSIYFSKIPMEKNEIVFHPYYNQPLNLNKTSQEALTALVKKNYSLWTMLSPLRQQTLNLNLKEKIKANSASATVALVQAFPESKLRVFPKSVTFGDISFEDEMEIYHDQSIIPLDLRPYIPSLVWLALKDKTFIEQKFEKLDAKYLASGWIAAPEILNQLEQCVPEKKMLLIKSYLNSNAPSKISPAFQFLTQLGFEVSNENYEPTQKAS